MPLIAAGVIWAGYTAAWWGWLAVTDRVPNGPSDMFHWPSIKDLVSPGRIGAINMTPARAAGKAKAQPVAPGSPEAAGVTSGMDYIG